MVLNNFVIHDRALPDPAATAAAAGKLAELCQPGDVLCLFGDLGAGKTTFARGFLRALGVADAATVAERIRNGGVDAVIP